LGAEATRAAKQIKKELKNAAIARGESTRE
jgi:hypothetical protein